jgi:thioesterase domain-containing protein
VTLVHGGVTQHGDVIALRAGDGPTAVLVHPIGGNVFCYRSTAQQLPGWNVFGLRRNTTSGLAGGVHELARNYLAVIDAAGIEIGVLGGWSFGAVAAFEIGRLLEARGEPRRLVLVDPPLVRPIAPGSSGLPRALRLAWRDLCRLSGRPLKEPWPALETIEDAESACASLGILQDVQDVDRRWIFELYAASAQDLHGWEPSGRVSSLIEIRALGSHLPPEERGWADLAGDHEVRPVDGDHEFLLEPRGAAEVARAIRWAGGDARRDQEEAVRTERSGHER